MMCVNDLSNLISLFSVIHNRFYTFYILEVYNDHPYILPF